LTANKYKQVNSLLIVIFLFTQFLYVKTEVQLVLQVEVLGVGVVVVGV